MFLSYNTCSFIKKESLAQVFSCEFREISKNTFFTEDSWTTASALNVLRLFNFRSETQGSFRDIFDHISLFWTWFWLSVGWGKGVHLIKPKFVLANLKQFCLYIRWEILLKSDGKLNKLTFCSDECLYFEHVLWW